MMVLLPLDGGGGDYIPPGSHDFVWGSIAPGLLPDWVNKPFAQAVLGALLVIVFWLVASRKLQIVPRRGQFFAEYVYEFVRNGIARETLHHEYRRYVPFLLALFSFILVNNWFGEFFYFMYPTFSNIGYPFALALLSWLVYVGAGFRKFGLGFLRRALVPEGVPLYTWPLIIPLEFIATFITRPLTLALRLFANLFAGHLMVLVLIVGGAFLVQLPDNIGINLAGWASLIFSLVILLLELFIGALQAFVFTVLTAQYVSSSISEAH